MEKNIKRICEWTKKEFFVDFKHRNQRFIDKNAMYAWRKNQNREMVKCLNCGKEFERYKNILHPRSGKLTQYCSNYCNITSDEKKEKLRNWIKNNNPMNSEKSRKNISITKLKRYGNENYNNIVKCKNTMMGKYGVECAFDIPKISKSNGKRVSKFQKRIYDDIKLKYSDAVLEHYLVDVKRSVDIYIPSKKLIIECFGDYWHCNPDKCKSDYYNKSVHLTAKQIWDKDISRINSFKNYGYSVEVIWENSNKNFNKI